MAEYKTPVVIQGEGGGGKGGGSSRVAQEDPNTLRSKNVATVLDLLGEGPIYGLVNGLQSVFLDGVPVENPDGSYNYNGLTLMTRQGYPDQSAIPGLDGVYTEYGVNKEVRNDSSIVEGFTNAEADVINVKIQVQALTYQDKKTGDLKGGTVAFAVDIRDSDSGAWVKKVHKTLKGKTTSPYQTQFKVRLPSGGPNWQVRVRRLTPDDQGAHFSNDIYFVSMTSIIEAKLTYPDSALIGFRADASQFGTSIPERAYLVRGMIINVPSNYDPITREYTGTWNGTFKKAWTDNPAWILYDMVTNTRYGAGQTQFYKWDLYAIGQYCDELVPDGYGGMEPRFTCNVVITAQEDAYAAIDSIASIFRGMVYWSSSEITAVADRPGTPKRTFTRANIIDDFVRQGTSMKARHSVVLVTWNDPDDQYKKTIEMVTDQEMIKKWGWRQTEVTQVGCTSRGQARRAGKWIMYSEKWETETISYAATSDAMDLRPGDLVQISDPAVSGVRLGGRALVTGTTELTLDRVDGIDTNEQWQITVTMPNGGAETRNILNFQGTKVTLDVALPEVPVTGAVWTISSTDVVPELFKIISLSDPGVELQPKITAVSHNPGKYALVEEDVPLPDRPVSLLPTGRISPPSNLKAVQHTYLQGSTKAQGVMVSWTPSEDVRAASYRLEVMAAGEVDWSEVYSGTGVQYTVKDTDAGEWSFRVKAVAAQGASSVWVYLAQDVQNELMPTMPEGVTFTPGTLKMGINPQGDAINQLWEVRRAGVALDLADVESNAALVGIGTSFVDTELSPMTTYYYYVRGTNTFGVSDWYPAQATTEADASTYLGMLNGEIRLTELHQDLQTEIDKISGSGIGSVSERLNEVNERLTGIKDALEDVDDNFAGDLERIDAAVAAAQAQLDEAEARLDEAEARLDGRSDVLQQEVDDLLESLNQETDRIDQDIQDVIDATDDIRESLEGEVERIDAAVTGVEQAASNARDQLAQTDAELQQRVDAADQAILDETSTRETEDSVLAQGISALSVASAESQSRISNLERVSIETDLIEAIQFNAIEVSKAGASAAVRTEESARVEGDQALAQTITQLTARVGGAEADITTVDQARVDGDSILSSRIGELSAKLDATPQFGSGFEPGSDFGQWIVPSSDTLTASTSDVYLGTQSALLTSTQAAPSSSGSTGATRAIIPSGAAEAFEGYEVVVTAAIKQPASNASTEMALAYSTNGAGNSGWQRFPVTSSWSVIEFRYTVPEGAASSDDYIGVWADTSGSGKGILIDTVNIRRANAEISEITAAIQEEQQARANADQALTSSLQNLETNFQGISASLTQEQQARANADSAMASDISALQTELGDANAAITSEAATRLSKDNALATRASNLESRMDSAESSITTEERARTSADNALTNQINSANSRIDDAESAITSEAQTRASQDTALTNQINSTNSRIDDAESAITSEAQTRANQDSALAASIQSLESRIDDSGGMIVDEARVRASEDEALAQAINSVSASLGEANASIQALRRAQAEADALEAIQFSAIEVTKAGASASIRTEEQVRVTETSALASRATSLESRMGSAESSITSEAQTRASKDTALTNQINSTNSRIDDVEADITSEAQTRASKDTALTNQINSANSKISANEAAITSEAQTRASQDNALSTRINAVVATAGSNSTAITNETAARTSADNALGIRIDTAVATAANATAALEDQYTASVAGTSLVQDGMFVHGKDMWADNHINLASRDLDGGGFHSTMPAPICAVFNNANQGSTRHVTAGFESVVPGDQFSCSMHYAKMDSANGTLRMSVQFYDDANTLISWVTVEEKDMSSAPPWTWQKMEGRLVTAPEGTNKGRVVVTLSSDNTQGRCAFTAVQAFRTDAILSERVSTVQAQLGQDIASVQTTATAQYNALNNRLSAKWGVVLDNNGYVSGWGQENDGNTSTTIFRTDRLLVAQPGKDADYIFAIDGTKTVIKDALIGDLAFTKLVDSTGNFLVSGGKVKAQYIQADQLEVEYGKIKNVNVDTGDIKNLSVSTLKIQDQAVNFPTGSQSGGQTNIVKINRNNATFVMDHYHASSGANAMITVAGCVREITRGLTANMAIEVYINSSLTHSSPIGTTSGDSGDPQPSSFNFSLTLNRTLPKGNPRIWYKLRHITGMSQARAEVLYRGIYVVEMKK